MAHIDGLLSGKCADDQAGHDPKFRRIDAVIIRLKYEKFVNHLRGVANNESVRACLRALSDFPHLRSAKCAMMRTATSVPPLLEKAAVRKRSAISVLLVLGALLLVLGGLDLLVQIHAMAASLTQVSSRLETLGPMSHDISTMRLELSQTNRTLAQTNKKLDLTNTLLQATNDKLDRTNSQLLQTNVHLGAMTGRLSAMASTLQGMQRDIGVMAKKLTHAKLLF